ncbi:glycosyltransferase family 4 protein [Planctomycetota bacterium]
MKVFHILNSDFGLSSTAGYRSYQIAKHTNHDVTVSARKSFSDIEVSFHKIFPFYREFARFTQMIGQKKYYSFFFLLKRIGKYMFDKSIRNFIDEQNIIHFFHFSPKLVRYAKSLGKVTIAEGYTHPSYLERMHKHGVGLESGFKTDEDVIKTYEMVDCIVSPSRWVTTTLKSEGVPEDKIVEIPYGVHEQPDKIYDLRSRKIKFMFAGGLKRTKGVIDLLQSWDDVSKNNGHKIELHLYGRSYKSTQKIIQDFKVKNSNIYCHGFVRRIFDEYKKNDVYIYPTYFEGSSKTVFEAMSFGLPVITSENAGSIVINEEDGYIIPINDKDSLSEKIMKLSDKNLIAKMGQNAQKHARKYSWQWYAKNVNSLYDRLSNGEIKIHIKY